MASVDLWTAGHTDAVFDEQVIVGGIDDDGHLILTTRGGTPIDAGLVQGSKWGTTAAWAFVDSTDVVVDFPGGAAPLVGDHVISLNGFSLGEVYVITAVTGPTNADIAYVTTIRGPAGADAPTPLLDALASSATTAIVNNTVTHLSAGWGYTTNDGLTSVPSSGTFRVTDAGLYILDFQASWASSSVGRRASFIFVNGVEVRRQDVAVAGSSTVQVVEHMYLAANDDVTFRVFQTSGGNLALGAPFHKARILKLA